MLGEPTNQVVTIEDEDRLDEVSKAMHRLKAHYVPFPQEEKVRSYLDRLIRTGRGNRMTGDSPDIIAIWGPARSGKTRLTLEWAAQFPAYEEVTADTRRDIVPVLYVRTPGNATMKSLFKRILRMLGIDLQMTKMRDKDENDLGFMIIDLLKKLKVRLVIIDEIHHLLEKTATTVLLLQKTANSLKVLADEAGVPMVFLGLPKANKILEFDPQIKGRTRRVVTIRNFNWEDPTERLDCCGFIQALEQAMQLPKRSGLYEESTARCIWAITEGYAGRIAKFMYALADDAYQTGTDHITRELLIDMVDTMPGCGPKRNPFRDEKSLQLLIERKQPEFDESFDDEEGDADLNFYRGNRKPKIPGVLA